MLLASDGMIAASLLFQPSQSEPVPSPSPLSSGMLSGVLTSARHASRPPKPVLDYLQDFRCGQQPRSANNASIDGVTDKNWSDAARFPPKTGAVGGRRVTSECRVTGLGGGGEMRRDTGGARRASRPAPPSAAPGSGKDVVAEVVPEMGWRGVGDRMCVRSETLPGGEFVQILSDSRQSAASCCIEPSSVRNCYLLRGSVSCRQVAISKSE